MTIIANKKIKQSVVVVTGVDAVTAEALWNVASPSSMGEDGGIACCPSGLPCQRSNESQVTEI